MSSIARWAAAFVLSTGCAHGTRGTVWPGADAREVLSVTVVAAGEVVAFGRWPMSVGRAVRLVAAGERPAWLVEATPARSTGRPGHTVAMAVRGGNDGRLLAAPVVWIEPGRIASVDVRAGGVPLRVEVGIASAAPWQTSSRGTCKVAVGRPPGPAEPQLR